MASRALRPTGVERGARGRWARVALAGQAAWFFGNAYEAAVDVPRLIADARTAAGRRGLLSAGSPVRYYAPIAPAAVLATAVSLLDGQRNGGSRPAIVLGWSGFATAIACSAYLIRTVNIPLLTSSEPMRPPDREAATKRWHQVNAVRLAALATSATCVFRLARHRTAAVDAAPQNDVVPWC